MHLIRYLRHPTIFLIDLPSIPKLLAIFIQANFFLRPDLYSGDALFQGMSMPELDLLNTVVALN